MKNDTVLPTLTRGNKTCDCYVRTLPAPTQMELRYGAHALACPVYRRSLDPLDRAYDEEYRFRAAVSNL